MLGIAMLTIVRSSRVMKNPSDMTIRTAHGLPRYLVTMTEPLLAGASRPGRCKPSWPGLAVLGHPCLAACISVRTALTPGPYSSWVAQYSGPAIAGASHIPLAATSTRSLLVRLLTGHASGVRALPPIVGAGTDIATG